MDDDVLLSLAIATQFAHHATYAGTSRQAIADGYSAIDAVFSALLHTVPVEPPRIHKVKLQRVKELFPKVFDDFEQKTRNGFIFSQGVPWNDIEKFYGQWLEARYEKFEMTATEARKRVAQVNRAMKAAKRYVASNRHIEYEKLDRQVDASAFGFGQSELHQALSDAHDHLFAEAERLGEQFGKRLGVKMADTTNFSELDMVIAGDTITREIINTDKEISAECVEIYIRLCRLADRLRYRRFDLLQKANGDDKIKSANEATEFMFAVKFKYHGEKLMDTAQNLFAALGRALTPDPRERTGT